ncbi:MAG: hypothetical protein JSV45_09795 [Chromatiales bacterium]|nr:MAG: hypothetical protein JSV45_09795 [Chromatiales bacterium]
MNVPWLNPFTALLLFACLVAWSASEASAADLGTWVDQDLAPYVAEQLTEHPRFKGETVVFVGLNNGAPAPVTNKLVLAIRQRLANTLVDQPGINIGWQSTNNAAGRDGPAVDCTRDTVHYYLGLEVTQLMDGRHRVALRVLDATDRSWVTGTGQSWEGRLTRKQKDAFKQAMTDEYFRGSREVPYTSAQADLLAARLAHEFTCNLLRQVSGEYVIAAKADENDTANTNAMSGALALVRNNLAGQPALQLTSNVNAANARLEGKAHAIAGDLYQYWVTITPTGDADTVPAVSASTYVRLPYTGSTTVAQTNVTPPAPLPVNAVSNDLLTPLRIVEPRKRRACNWRGSYRRAGLVTADHHIKRGDCFLLETRAERDASVFLLNYQVIHGLVTLAGPRCGQTQWINARAGQPLHFPTAQDVRQSASAWQGHPGLESFYAIAVSDPNAARELSAHVGQLPARCTLSAKQGLEGLELEAWLGGLRDITHRWQHALDWQAVRVEHVY